jgi:hypothetical protein
VKDEVVQMDFLPAPNKRSRLAAERNADKPEGDKPPRQFSEAEERLAIPVLPSLDVDPEDLKAPDQRSVACVNMRLAGAPFHEIAKMLEYASPGAAKAAFIAALASLHPREDWETLRQIEAMRAEQLLTRSLAMSAADYLVDKDNPEIRIPNRDKLKWHEQAGKDLMLHATITGAKAPVHISITPSEQELDEIVQGLLAARGELPELEGEVIDFEDVPEEPEEES